jgi:hypothetical protein
MVKGLVLDVWGSVFRIQGSGFRVQGVQGLGFCNIQDRGINFKFQIQNLKL